MDWSKIKTIFIITFLILDVYLLFQFMEVRDANKYEIATEASFEEKLKADEITYNELPKTSIKGQYLSSTSKTFSKGDLAKLKGQAVSVKDAGNTLQVTLDRPIQLSAKFEPADLSAFFKENVLFGEHYQFWEKDDKKNTITYLQQYESFPLYQNLKGMITFTLNGDNQIISYEQTYLEDFKTLTAKEDILTPIKAIETLHQKGVLRPKSKITKIELGYSSKVKLAASQVLAPTWRFVVNEKENLFVNAFEGQIIDFNSDENSKVE
ncbi:two-component system regulatory protein YycI [Neobacillus sp. MM2021_6]|uniref:two-component system regulatory protein YycI n=1 Tax=Bacillaceae TaxID=186817 RepID=UPI0014087C34|nr:MULTISPECIES: two-component system regulatory protein YycI [Bacillaceae]MBO0958431.1 two-component system regulatory protein YycI [Neobacillus sp. MM2021_6]NHC20752.1 hypothetical protein [Bacillus sp. MM2020_4]WML41810.1 two-component system regulatory protein YycI [Neobacillus sp. OS1-2]